MQDLIYSTYRTEFVWGTVNKFHYIRRMQLLKTRSVRPLSSSTTFLKVLWLTHPCKHRLGSPSNRNPLFTHHAEIIHHCSVHSAPRVYDVAQSAIGNAAPTRTSGYGLKVRRPFSQHAHGRGGSLASNPVPALASPIIVFAFEHKRRAKPPDGIERNARQRRE